VKPKYIWPILMDIPCILYSLLSRPTNARHIYVLTIFYIYRKHSWYDENSHHTSMQ